jgi:hypothetical protein
MYVDCIFFPWFEKASHILKFSSLSMTTRTKHKITHRSLGISTPSSCCTRHRYVVNKKLNAASTSSGHTRSSGPRIRVTLLTQRSESCCSELEEDDEDDRAIKQSSLVQPDRTRRPYFTSFSTKLKLVVRFTDRRRSQKTNTHTVAIHSTIGNHLHET